jgi:gliding motility-associated-like protein
MKKTILVILSLALAFTTVAQSKMNFALARKALTIETDKDENVCVLIQGDVQQIKMLVKSVGGHFKYSTGNIASVSISINQLSKVISHKAIKRIEAFPPKVKPLSDTVLDNNKVYPVHYGQAPLPHGYDGSGVIIGFIDFGIDFNHPDFKDTLGKSRILWLWDQSKANAANTPMPYNYGQEWSNTDIDNGLCTHNPSADYGHGTHVAGIAAGNGLATGGFLGTAPKSDIIAVYVTNSVLDAVSYIYSKAQTAGKPCVINASVGSDFGPHDGKDLESEAIDSLINSHAGQSFIAAAGNSGAAGAVHLAYSTSPIDTNFTLFSPVGGNVYMYIIADSNNLKNINFSIGADKMSPTHSFRGNIPFVNVAAMPIQTPVSTNLMKAGKRIGVVQSYLDTAHGDYLLQYYITPDSTSYYWRLMATGSGSFDLWNYDNNNNYAPIVNSGLPPASTMPDSIYYKFPDTDKTIEGGFQCLNSVITVANYINRKSYTDCNGNPQLEPTQIPGQLAASSSIGPTRDGRIKPDIASPGEVTMAAIEASTKSGEIGTGKQYQLAQGCYHWRGTGTSNSCPGVAGIAALYLQKNPTATAAQVKQAIINSAAQDQFTGNSLPDKYWGYGKVDALAALTESLTVFQPLDTTVCENDSAVFTVKYNRTGLSYQWQVNQGSGFNNLSNAPPYNGVTTDSLTITAAPFSFNNYTYRCIINNCSTCVKSFHAAKLTVNPAPSITTTSKADSICFNANSQSSRLTYSTTSNTPATYSIVWNATAISQGFVNDTNVLLPVSPIYIKVPANAMTATYAGTITVKNGLGCSSTSANNFTITIDTLPIATTGGNSIICSDSSVTISGAHAQYGTIAWTEDGTGNITSGGLTISPTYTASAGDEGNTVTLTMTVSNGNICSSSATYTVKVDSLPVALVSGNKTICSDSTITINSAVAKNGSIVWTTNGAGNLSNASSVSPTYAALAGDEGNVVILTMTVTSTNNCVHKTAIATYSLIIDSLPKALAGGSQTICADSTVTIIGASASNGTIFWTENGSGSIISGVTTESPVYAATVNDGGNQVLLTMTVTSTNTCTPATATDTYTIHVNPLPLVNITGLALSYCYNASAKTLTGTPSGGVFSGIGITDAINGVFNPVVAGAGTYTITYKFTDSNSCSNIAGKNTTVLPQPATPDSCTTTTGINSITRIDQTDIILSNVFTPNDDGVNDVFFAESKTDTSTYSGGNIGNYLMNIYNRWGELIYFSTSPNIGWDGTTMAGVKLAAGTYYYTVYIGKKKHNGFVSLIK